MSQDAPAPPLPPGLLAGAAVAVAVPVLTVGALLFALPEETGPRVAGLALLAAGLVTVGSGLAALRRPAAPGAPLRLAAAVLLVAAVAAVTLVAVRGAFLLDLLVVGGVPGGAALVLALLARATRPPAAA